MNITGQQNRKMEFRAASVDKEARTVKGVSVSSSTPVSRPWGNEILSHDSNAINLCRLMGGALPLLINHDQTQLNIGVARDFVLDGDKLRATLIFGEGARADEVLANVQNGTVTGISIGYMIDEYKEDTQNGDVTVTRWTPYEISIVGVPADVSVGIGRSFDENPVAKRIREFSESHNGILTDLAEQAIAQGWKFERFESKAIERLSDPRTNELVAVARREHCPAEMLTNAIRSGHSAAELQTALDKQERDNLRTLEAMPKPTTAGRSLYLWQKSVNALLSRYEERDSEAVGIIRRRADSENMSIDEVREAILNQFYKSTPVVTPAVAITEVRGMNHIHNRGDNWNRNLEGFSVCRAIMAAADNNWSNAGLEREVHQEELRKMGKRDSRGVCIPLEVFAMRALSVGTATAGGNIVGTDLRGDQFIDPLRNVCQVANLGGQMLTGLYGDVAIPKQTGSATASWVDESAAVPPTDPSFAQVTLSPKTVGALTRLSRKLVLQGTPSIENIVNRDLLAVVGLAIDGAAINGTGANGQPRGILATAGIGAVVGGDNGAAPTWGNIVALTSSVANSNADSGQMAFLTNSKVRGKLMTVQKATNLPFIWENSTVPGEGILASYRAAVSNQVPSNLTKGTANAICSAIIFGNWLDVLIGQWGAITAEVDPYTYFDSGDLRIRVLADVDVAVRNAQSFAAMQDALTN